METPDIQNIIAQAFAQHAAFAARSRMQAMKARKEGKLEAASLLEALAASDDICARRLLMYLRGKIGETDDFLREVALKKKSMADSLFPEAMALAKSREDASAIEHCDRTGRVVKNQAGLLRRSEKESGTQAHAYFVCGICGYIASNAVPEKCPVCNAVKEKFISPTK